MEIMTAIAEFEKKNYDLDPTAYVVAAEKFAQDIWPHRAFDMSSENRENALLFMNAIVVRGLKNAGDDAIRQANKMQTGWKRMLNHVFGGYKATKIVEKLIFELEFK